MAEYVGMDRSFISDLENGKKEICLRNLELLATTFGLSMSKLLSGLWLQRLSWAVCHYSDVRSPASSRTIVKKCLILVPTISRELRRFSVAIATSVHFPSL
jgi:Helix-turn-helix.